MRPDFRMFQYSSLKFLIHHGDKTDQKDQIEKQA